MDKILSSTSRHLPSQFYDFSMLSFAQLLRFEVVLESYDTPESNQHTFCTLFHRDGRTSIQDRLYALYFSKCRRLGEMMQTNILLYF